MFINAAFLPTHIAKSRVSVVFKSVFFMLSLYLRILFDVCFFFFFSEDKRKKMGISGAAMVPEKTCTFRLCTHKHTKNVIALTLRERDIVVYTFQTASVCRCLSNTSLLPLTLQKRLFVWSGCSFCWHFALSLFFVQSPTRVPCFKF